MIRVECPLPSVLVENEINRVLTQYRESPNFLYITRTLLGMVAEVLGQICTIPAYFDLYDAVGHQLTLLGQRLGWPREHCVCSTQPVFGFDCDPEHLETEELSRPIAGFCDTLATWEDCGPFGSSTITLQDDETYRKFLFVRRYQMLGLYDIDSLTEALQIFFGPTAMVLDAGNGRVVLAPGRDLTADEIALLSLYPRVLPIAPGIKAKFHFDTVPVFGFGEGWLGFCQPHDYGAYNISTTLNDDLVTQADEELITGMLVYDPVWMCETDVDPYDCNITTV
jgi:hypothetical protein